jgi:RNA polymerase sigma-70 factor (ECF subfamily)
MQGRKRAMNNQANDFQHIYEEFYPKIVGYLRRLVGDPESEDVAQEVFVKVNRALDGFRGESSFSTWIYRIATNTAMDHLRKPAFAQRPENNGSPEEDFPEEDCIPDANAPVLDMALIRKDMNDCIRGIVDGLPENYRTVLVLSDLEGFTNAEIAEVLALTLDSVKIRLHRARTRLRKELETKCSFYRDERNELACDRKTTPLNFLKK